MILDLGLPKLDVLGVLKRLRGADNALPLALQEEVSRTLTRALSAAAAGLPQRRTPISHRSLNWFRR